MIAVKNFVDDIGPCGLELTNKTFIPQFMHIYDILPTYQ